MIDPSNDRQPWDRQVGEPEKAFQAFDLFCKVGAGRTVAGVAETLSKSRQLCTRWATRWDWRNRALAFDLDAAAQDRAARQRQRAEIVENTLRAARGLLDAAVRSMALRPGIDKQGNVVVDPATGDPLLVPPTAADLSAAATALNVAVKQLRLSLDLPTEHSRHDVELRETLTRALATQEILKQVIEHSLCDGCRAKVGAELRRLADQQAGGE